MKKINDNFNRSYSSLTEYLATGSSKLKTIKPKTTLIPFIDENKNEFLTEIEYTSSWECAR